MSVAPRFLIDTTEFGIGFVRLFMDPLTDTFTLEITGDETLATAIGATESHPFNWIIYPPKFYVRDAVFTSADDTQTLKIDEDAFALDEYDIALYLIEHNDVLGMLTLNAEGLIIFSGTVIVNGKAMKLEISARV